MEGRAAVLRRPDEGRRPAGRLLERLQREPDAVPAGQVRHVDRRHRRRLLRHRPEESTVADKVGFALAPDTGIGKHGNWLWSWTLAIPASSKNAEAAKTFIAWATTKDYTDARRREGRLGRAPPGTRTSLYENADYQAAAPFAEMTLDRDQRRRHHQSVGTAGALYRRAVRGDPRVPGDRHHRRPALLGGARRPDHRSTTRSPRPRRSTDARDEARRLLK